MRKLNPLSKGEKWIVALTLVFALAMTGAYIYSTRMDESDEYTIRAGELAQGTAPIETVQWQVNINTATVEELTHLPGVGEVLAERIVAYREAHGAFRTAEELLEVDGIGESKFADMKDRIVLKEAEQ
ncbi:MAG: helix-hairpin-helix domain-containing protein [Oscillospiraceae bacterium]|nr:helix-hairpin-helix domain-containing protein [Oscillospiraceae bacterium]